MESPRVARPSLGAATRRTVVEQLRDWDDHVGRVARRYETHTTPLMLEKECRWNNGEAHRYLGAFRAAVDNHQPTNWRVTDKAVKALDWVLETNLDWAISNERRPLTGSQRSRIRERIAHLRATRPQACRRPMPRAALDELAASLASGSRVHALYVHRARGIAVALAAVARKVGRSADVAERLYPYIATRVFERVYLAPQERQNEIANREDEQWLHDVLAYVFELSDALAHADVRIGDGEIFTVTLNLLDLLTSGIGYTIGEIPDDDLSQQRIADALRSARRAARRRAA